MNREQKVAQFVEAAGKETFNFADNKFDLSIINGLTEELEEFVEAVLAYLEDPETNRANLCKEWADVQYVVSQAAWYFNIPSDESFNRVHENNLTKIGPDGVVQFREDGKIQKPEGYVPCDMSGL